MSIAAPATTLLSYYAVSSVEPNPHELLACGARRGGRAPGERVRLGRALLRPGVRLAILDEPFRGLDRAQRRELLARVRRAWAGATLLCITHDIGETRAFDRVVIIEGGRIVGDGSPAELCARPNSPYRAMLDAEDAVRTGLWSRREWRRLRLEDGRLIADGKA